MNSDRAGDTAPKYGSLAYYFKLKEFEKELLKGLANLLP